MPQGRDGTYGRATTPNPMIHPGEHPGDMRAAGSALLFPAALEHPAQALVDPEPRVSGTWVPLKYETAGALAVGWASGSQ